ncbi:MAG: hypothetical protein Q8P54_02750 [bacterium]|nr:hypothetical protein [bacterium]
MNPSNFISQINPTPVFWLSLTPLPVIIYLNMLVFHKLMIVRHLSHHHEVKKPKIYKRGIVFNSLSAIFVYLPAIIEWRIFVKDPRWIIFYLIGAFLAIAGLLMVIKGLNIEIYYLSKKRSKKGQIKFT